MSSNKVDHEFIQRKLEGRCILCGEYLPKHDSECKNHPVNVAIANLEIIKANLKDSAEYAEGYTDVIANVVSKSYEK